MSIQIILQLTRNTNTKEYTNLLNKDNAIKDVFKLKYFVLHFRLCTDLQTLISERAEIEKGYAKSLRTWSKKWADLIEKGNCFMFIET